MRATLTFSADTEEILEDVALILKNRIRSYNRAVNRYCKTYPIAYRWLVWTNYKM